MAPLHDELTTGQKAARTRKRRLAAKKAALTNKWRSAGRKAAATRDANKGLNRRTCPKCESEGREPSTRFFWVEEDDRLFLRCERTLVCGWRLEINLPQPLS